MFYSFLANVKANEKLNIDFEKYCSEKIKIKIEKAKESCDIKQLEEILEKYGFIVSLPDIRILLMEEYFKGGNFLKALSHANFIFDNYPQYQSKISAKIILLENICEILPEQRKIIPDNLIKSETKLNGQTISLEKLSDATTKTKNSIGKFLKAIPLEPIHIQYRNHPQIPIYQPIEPLFTKNNIVLNGASYLVNYNSKTNEVEWSYHSEAEYDKDNGGGPYQKRFITRHSGNQLFMVTNRDFSEKKTVKCFDLSGNLLWDISDQKSSIAEEPFCTPIESQGKLFCLTNSNRETIDTVSFSIFDSYTGRLISKIPISYYPPEIRDEGGRGLGNFDSFTHDDHFTKDGSYVFGYTGTGIILKADANSGSIIWEKGFPKSNTNTQGNFWNDMGYAPSGYIHLYDDVLLAFMPDIQIFTAIDKNSGSNLWKTKFYAPKYIHDRGKTNYLYFSSDKVKNDPILFKVNPKTGEIIWQTPTNGLMICGEGDILGNKLYIPSEKSILVFGEETGNLIDIIKLNIQPIKIRCRNNHTVILSANTAFILQNDGAFDSKQLTEIEPIVNTAKLVEPDSQPFPVLSFENINLETTLKLPENFYANGNPFKQTKLLKTSKPFHFLLVANEHVALFREGYYQKDGKYIPPEIMWYGQYPQFCILEDTFYVSEYGRIIATNLFTREKLWVYEYDRSAPVYRNNSNKMKPAIAVTKQYIAYQTENQSICILNAENRNKIFEFYSVGNSSLLMDGNYLIATGPKEYTNLAKCYDLSQKGKEIWSQGYNANYDIAIDNGKFVFVRNHDSTITFYDLKTGAVVLHTKSTNGHLYTMNNWLLTENILYAYKMLFDAKTGLPLEKYKEGAKVTGGGFIGFFKQYGSEGNFIKEGKEYFFKTKCDRDYRNNLFSAVTKGNRVTFFSSYDIETFEIANDQLISRDYCKFYSGPNGNHEFGVSMLPLDNSFLMIRGDEMYFFKNFDLNLNFEKIKSCRVDNKKNVAWPFSEIYPEIEVDDKNWISYNGEKPQRKFSYQAFGDERFAYLKFKLSPKLNNNLKDTLFISANGYADIFAITWDVDNWKNCQYTFNIRENIESWKEIDIRGNTILYIKLQLVSPISKQFKNTLPDFNIELRQMSGKQNDGMFRLGGAYFKNRKFFPWMNYLNDEAQNLKNFAIRNNLYENGVNFYPQGDDLVLWLKDRRRFKSVENNIQLLNKMLEANSKYYCSVNILSALFLEELQLTKLKQPELNEISDEFNLKVNEIISRLHKNALAKGINKEWADFALSFWTFEIFPHKFNYEAWRSDIFKAINGVIVKSDKTVLMRSDFSQKDNILTENINQPYLEWVLPGLTASFPKNLLIDKVEFHGVGPTKTSFGKMTLYLPTGSQEFCNRKGIFISPTAKITGGEKFVKLEIKENFYNTKGVHFECFNIITTLPIINIAIELPPIKSPIILEKTGQTTDTIMSAIENLPSDNNNGQMLIDYYLSLKENIEEGELIKVYGKWLNSVKDNSSASYNAIKNIFNKYDKRKNKIEFLGNIIKEAKLTPFASRHFFLDNINNFVNKNARSVLGPVMQELETKPEITFDPTLEYKAGELKYKFTDVLESKNGGTIYVASKITLEDKEKVYLYARAAGPYYSQSIFSIWVNGNPIVEGVNYLKYEDDTFSQKISLNKGDNIILLKISGLKDRDWGYYYSINIGDVYGIPINGVEMKPVHK
jgi:hypothetical protein